MLRTALTLAAVAALGTAAVPQLAAAQSFYEDGARPYALHAQDDIAIDGDHARVERRLDIDPRYRGGRAYPPRVVYDERGPGAWRDGWHDREGYGYGRPAYRPGRPAYGYAPAAYGYAPPPPPPPPPPVYGPGYRPGYASAGYGIDPAPVGPVPVGYGYGTIPEVGCRIEQSQGITPAGWRKIVTHRICYRR